MTRAASPTWSPSAARRSPMRPPSRQPSRSGTTGPTAAGAAAGSRSRGRCRPGSERRRSQGSRCRAAPTTRTPTASSRASATRRTSASRRCAAASAATPCRLVPDVSAQADEFTGAITVYRSAFGGGWSTIGGTSSSTPIWAAMLALVNASATCAAHAATRDGVGFVSPLLYAVASNPGDYAASFNDITTGNNDIYGLDDGQVFPATTGYDLASGLGSPRLTGPGGTAGLAYYLCSLGAASKPARRREADARRPAAPPAGSRSRSPGRDSSRRERRTSPRSRSATRQFAAPATSPSTAPLRSQRPCRPRARRLASVARRRRTAPGRPT